MRIESVGDSFAHEVHDLPLWGSVSDSDAADIRDAYRQYGVLVFRRQSLSEKELLAFGKMIGKPALYAETDWQSAFPEVIILSNMRDQSGDMLGGLANKALSWHTDQSYYAKPVTGCFLYGVELPEEGGGTSWSNLFHAYETLPADLTKAVDGAVGTFSFASRVGSNPVKDDNHDRAKRIAETPDIKHPLVNIEPGSGRKALYIDPNTVTGIDGLPQDEADDLLNRLLEHATQPNNVYDHNWGPGDLVLWDNATVLHKREGFPNECNRLVKRMIINLDPTRHIIPPVLK
ncbi:MAG: TauD/TfdA family dioxygenase [Alphaproteobacteria bacterium]|nr:TauD/TfdA family dioxygenase [Alphaproteobacteria bacterium]